MKKLSLQDAKFLKINAKYLPNLIKLRDGEIRPTKPSHKRFIDVLQGKILPTTQWERAFLHWTEMDEPNLVQFILSKIDENRKKNNISKSTTTFKYPSNKNDKKLSKKQNQFKIDITHRKSGYYKQKVRFVSGGLPSLGKKR